MRCMAVAAVLAPCALVTPVASAQEGIDPAHAAELEAIHRERDAAWALAGVGAALFTFGGISTVSYFFPSSDGTAGLFFTSCISAGVGLVLLLTSVGLGVDQHARTDALIAAGVHLVAGPGDVGLSLAVRFDGS